MELGTTLGTWHEVDCHAWFNCYRVDGSIDCRDKEDGKFYVFLDSGVVFYN